MLYTRFPNCLQCFQLARNCLDTLLLYDYSVMPHLASALRCTSPTNEVVIRPLGTACQHLISLSDYADAVLLCLATVLPSYSRKHVCRSNSATHLGTHADEHCSGIGHLLCLEVFSSLHAPTTL
jgi:hypothetical protein